MRDRFLIIGIALLIIATLIFLPLVVKKTPRVSQVSESIDVQASLQEAEALVEKGALLEAKNVYQRLIETSLSSREMDAIQRKSENLNIKILFSGINIKESQIYQVKSGDVLVKIAKKFNTTVDAIVKANSIRSNIIRPGMKLRILKGKFSIFVDKSQNTLILSFNDQVVKTYSVATGKNNSTPIGTYKIVNKLIDPVWYKDGKAIPPSSPANILGSRWLGFDIPEYGIHGTTSPDKIGKQITEGCVRMRNADVEEIYSLLPVGTEVTIID